MPAIHSRMMRDIGGHSLDFRGRGPLLRGHIFFRGLRPTPCCNY